CMAERRKAKTLARGKLFDEKRRVVAADDLFNQGRMFRKPCLDSHAGLEVIMRFNGGLLDRCKKLFACPVIGRKELVFWVEENYIGKVFHSRIIELLEKSWCCDVDALRMRIGFFKQAACDGDEFPGKRSKSGHD